VRRNYSLRCNALGYDDSRRVVANPELIQKPVLVRRQTRSFPQTGFAEISGDVLEADFWTIFREGGLASLLLVRTTYGRAIYQHLSAPTSLRDNFEYPTTQPP
jgi:hypothetical protein